MTKFLLSVYKCENGYIVADGHPSYSENRKEWVVNDLEHLLSVISTVVNDEDNKKKEEL